MAQKGHRGESRKSEGRRSCGQDVFHKSRMNKNNNKNSKCQMSMVSSDFIK